MTDFFSLLSDLFSSEPPPPPELLGQRIQQRLQVILAGLDEREALSAGDVETLRRELRMLLKLERIQVAAAEMDKSEQVLQYMLRPSFEDCLNLWFGKSEQTDQEIAARFGADVALASNGRPLGARRRASPPAGGASDHARPIPAQHVPRHAAHVRDRCALPRARPARAARRRRRAPAPDRAGVPLPRADALRAARGPAPVHGGMGPRDGRPGGRRPAERVPRDLPPPRRRDPALRALSPPQQDPAAREHGRRGRLPR